MESNNLPLDGICVVDLSRVLAGPYCTLLLSMLGANVIKVEGHTGDESRAWPPLIGGLGATFYGLNLNKRSVVVDLKSEDGPQIIRDLARSADVLVENFKTGTMGRFGLDYETLHTINPRLVYSSITAFGDRGPRAEKPGYEALMQAYSGVMSITGEPEGEPVRCGVSFHDMATGIASAFAIVTALFRRERTGMGGKLNNSLLQTALGLMSIQVTNYYQGGEVPTKLGSAHPMVVPYQVFHTQDRPMMIASANQNLWERLCRALGLDALLDDPRFKDNPARVANREACLAYVSEAIRRHGFAELESKLNEFGVPCAPVNSLPEMLGEEQVAALGSIIEVEDAELGTLKLSGLPFYLDGRVIDSARPAPRLGAHTREVLGELGYDDDRIASLMEQQVVAGA